MITDHMYLIEWIQMVDQISLDGLVKVKMFLSLLVFHNQVDVGEWLYFKNMGAYTCSAASTFNGFNKPLKYYTITHSCW